MARTSAFAILETNDERQTGFKALEEKCLWYMPSRGLRPGGSHCITHDLAFGTFNRDSTIRVW
jgi:hypothetical protein